MTFHEAIEQLTNWIGTSNGKVISLNDTIECEFIQHQTYTESELDMVERQLGWRFPESFRLFMTTVGHSNVFDDPKYGGGIEFYSLAQIVSIHEQLKNLDEEEPITDVFCMIGSSHSMGDFIGFAMNRESPTNFDIYCHEYPVFEYVSVSDEISSWRTFDDWLIHVVATLGEEVL